MRPGTPGSTTIGGKDVVVRAVVRCGGNVLKTAHELGIHRSHLYRLIKSFHLWPLVNATRKEEGERRRNL